MKKIIILLAILMPISSFSHDIAVVNMPELFEKSLAIKSVKDQLERISETIQAEMNKKERELKNEEEQIISKQATLSQEAYQREVEKFSDKVNKEHNIVQNKKMKLDRANAEAMEKVYDRIGEIIKQLAKKHNFKIAQSSTQIIWYDETLDITADILEQLNKSLKSVQVKYN